jgi:hypothetical protein
VVLARLGRFGEAQGEFQAALRINPNLQSAKKALEAIQTQGKTK